MLYVDIIVEYLSELKPSKSELFEENGKIYKEKLTKIDEELSHFIKNLDKDKRYIVSC